MSPIDRQMWILNSIIAAAIHIKISILRPILAASPLNLILHRVLKASKIKKLLIYAVLLKTIEFEQILHISLKN